MLETAFVPIPAITLLVVNAFSFTAIGPVTSISLGLAAVFLAASLGTAPLLLFTFGFPWLRAVL